MPTILVEKFQLFKQKVDVHSFRTPAPHVHFRPQSCPPPPLGWTSFVHSSLYEFIQVIEGERASDEDKKYPHNLFLVGIRLLLSRRPHIFLGTAQFAEYCYYLHKMLQLAKK